MKNREIYRELLENFTLQKAEAIQFINWRVGDADNSEKMLDVLSANIDKLDVLCSHLRVEVRLHQSNPLVIINQQQFYTTIQAAKILGISQHKVRQLITSGKLRKKEFSKTDWKIPNWSLEAYKNELCNFLMQVKEPLSEVDALDIYDSERKLLISIVSASGIHNVLDYEYRIKSKIANVITHL